MPVMAGASRSAIDAKDTVLVSGNAMPNWYGAKWIYSPSAVRPS
jgi:hypothetical protein